MEDFGQKQCFLGKKCTITWYLLYIILNKICKFAITRENDAFVANIANTRLTKTLVAIFALAERPPTAATLFQQKLIFAPMHLRSSSKPNFWGSKLYLCLKWSKGVQMGPKCVRRGGSYDTDIWAGAPSYFNF